MIALKTICYCYFCLLDWSNNFCDIVMNSFLCFAMVLLVTLELVLSRPAMQRLLINNHEWEVPNEPGWEEVINEVQLIHRLLNKCTTAAECRHIISELQAVFYRHAVSRKYLESNTDDAEEVLSTIFKWG